MHPLGHAIKSMNNLPILENYYKPIFDLFHLYIRGKCIIILYKRDGFGKLNITIPDSKKWSNS